MGNFPESYGHLMWNRTTQYRRRSSTIIINGFEVPEPLREIPEGDWNLYVPNISRKFLYSDVIPHDKVFIRDTLNKGLLHLTKEAAILHAKALLSFTEVPPMSTLNFILACLAVVAIFLISNLYSNPCSAFRPDTFCSMFMQEVKRDDRKIYK